MFKLKINRLIPKPNWSMLSILCTELRNKLSNSANVYKYVYHEIMHANMWITLKEL